jgi:hypothetical protein
LGLHWSKIKKHLKRREFSVACREKAGKLKFVIYFTSKTFKPEIVRQKTRNDYLRVSSKTAGKDTPKAVLSPMFQCAPGERGAMESATGVREWDRGGIFPVHVAHAKRREITRDYQK